VSLVFRILYTFEPSFKTIKRARQGNYIVGALFCTTAATSLMATSVICYKIYSSTAQNRHSRRQYKHIVDTLIQSSTLYTVVVLIATVAGFLDTGKVQTSIKIIVLNNYFESLMIMASVRVFLSLLPWLDYFFNKLTVLLSSHRDLLRHSWLDD